MGLPPIVGTCLRARVWVRSGLVLGAGGGGFQWEPTPPLCQFLSPPMQESGGIEPVAY